MKKTFINLLRQNSRTVTLALVLDVISPLLLVYAGYSLSFLFSPYESNNLSVIAFMRQAASVLGIWLFALVSLYLKKRTEAKAKCDLRNALRGIVSKKITTTEYTNFYEEDTGVYISWLTNDIKQISEKTFDSFFSFFTNLSTSMFSLFALFCLNPLIGVSAVIIFFFVSVCPQVLSKKLSVYAKTYSSSQETCMDAYKDAIMSYPVFYLHNCLDRLTERIASASKKVESSTFKYNCYEYKVESIVTAISMIGQIILLVVAIGAATAGAAPIGAALSVGNLAGSFFNAVGEAVQSVIIVKSSNILWAKFTFKTEAENSSKETLPSVSTISIRDLSYRYAAQTSKLHYDDITFVKGRKYAVTGKSGTGKTTFIKILLGLLTNYEGEIYFGKTELQKIELPSLYKRIAYVDQQPYLFNGSILDNVTLGFDYPYEEIKSALIRSGAWEFVDQLPGKMNYIISENGKTLSGGQRQRIAIARALIRSVDFIIIDEGTNGIDSGTAFTIENSLINEPDVGVIIITHQLNKQLQQKLESVYTVNNTQ